MLQKIVNLVVGPEFIFLLIAIVVVIVLIIISVKRITAPKFTCVHCYFNSKSQEGLDLHRKSCEHFKQWKLKNPKLSKVDKANEISDEKYLYILKQRLAKGEITLEEYNDLKEEFE